MVYKHNKRNWKYRALAMLAGYQFRVRAFTVPAPLCPLPSNQLNDLLIVVKCALCGMDTLTLDLCQNCGGCVGFEDSFGMVHGCCRCGQFSPVQTDLDPQSMVLETLS